jgi:hypothetical protein
VALQPRRLELVERLHRQFLEVVKLELEGFVIRDINNVQAMMLFNISDVEMTVGELTLRGCYLSSNVSYNVKKMVENWDLLLRATLRQLQSAPGRRSSPLSGSRARRHPRASPG